MKTIYKNLLYIALSILLCLFLAIPANAQHTSSGGGGGSSSGGSHSSGGGGGSSGGGSHPSGGGGSVSRPASSVGGYRGNASVSRPAGSFQRVGVSRQGAVKGNYGYAPRPGVAVNANYGYAPRVGVAPRGIVAGSVGYRTVPNIGYGRGGYWGNHGYYYNNHGYYKSYYLPRLGFTCAVLHYGYYPFYWGDYEYYYSDGLFYQYENSEYTVVEPPIGAEVTTLPDKAQSIVINGQQYYELNGVYYQPVTKDDGTVVYMVAGKDGELNTNSTVQDNQPQGPQIGDIVTQLPADCRKIKVNDQTLYVSPDGVYYQLQVDSNGNKTYKVVGLPSDEPETNQN